MAIVETLEIRFQADMGDLKAQIASVIAKLSQLSSISALAGAKISRAMSFSRDAIQARFDAVRKNIIAEGKYQSKLRGTARVAKSAGKAVRKTAKGIGLHRLDEINLLDAKKGSSGGGSSGGGGGSGIEDIADAMCVIPKVARVVAGSVKSLLQKTGRAFSGVAEGLDRMTGGVLGKIAEGFAGNGRELAETIKSRFASALQEGVEGAAQESPAPANAASKLVNRMADGMNSRKNTVSQAAKNVVSAADFSSKTAETEANSAGANLSQGFADGISSKLSAVKTSVSSIISAAVKKIKEKLKIHSPSKVTFAMGSYFGEGFSGGIAASVRSAQMSAQALSAGAADMLRADSPSFARARSEGGIGDMVSGAVNEALGNANLVIPLNVDGVKLGEASIRGINRVTRAAGRVLLEI